MELRRGAAAEAGEAPVGSRISRLAGARGDWLDWCTYAVLPATAAALFAVLSVRIHRAFHSNGWDLGLISQVIWNTSHGRWFEYSFRDISYAGDHFQPALLLFVPVFAAGGPEGLVIAQAVLLAAAAVPLALIAAPAGRLAAVAVAVAWLGSLGVAQAVSFDFHVEAVTPLLAFSAWLGAVRGRPRLLAVMALAILLTKEDAGLVVLAIAWLAFVRRRGRRLPFALAVVAIAYTGVAAGWVVPHFRGPDLNPFAERYAYLGDSPAEALRTIVTAPDIVWKQLARGPIVEAAAVLLLGSALLAVTNPWGLPAIALVTVPAMLSLQETQATLGLHYLLVPSAVMLLVVAEGLRTTPRRVRPFLPALAAGLVAATVTLWAWRSPLPPSFAADPERFRIDEHERLVREFVRTVPPDVRVSAQSHMVPHLARRRHIFQFPRVVDAEYVLIDDYGPKPIEDLAAGYDACRAALPQLGFDLVRESDGLALWRRARAAEYVPGVPVWCSGQRPGA